MRKEFASSILRKAMADPAMVFLTGDLGFMALENLRDSLGERFINAGVSEQNMMSVAAGLASEGLHPVCYSIASFAVFRPAEQIRLDICQHNLNVKIVGNGGGYGYGIMGSTHHALEDIAVMSSFPNMRCFIPYCNEEVEEAVEAMTGCRGPSYLRLGYGNRPAGITSSGHSPMKKLRTGKHLTVAGMGPVLLNALQCYEPAGNGVFPGDLFAVTEIPLEMLPHAFLNSVRSTQKLLVLEEHNPRGGLGEHLSALLLEQGISCKLVHLHARGYPGGRHGSQAYHQGQSNLDSLSVYQTIEKFIHE